jgi:hypothetical protein
VERIHKGRNGRGVTVAGAGADRVNLGKNSDARAKHRIVALIQPHIRLGKGNAWNGVIAIGRASYHS